MAWAMMQNIPFPDFGYSAPTKTAQGQTVPFKCETCKYYDKTAIDIEDVGLCTIFKQNVHKDACCNIWTSKAPDAEPDFNYLSGAQLRAKIMQLHRNYGGGNCSIL